MHPRCGALCLGGWVGRVRGVWWEVCGWRGVVGVWWVWGGCGVGGVGGVGVLWLGGFPPGVPLILTHTCYFVLPGWACRLSYRATDHSWNGARVTLVPPLRPRQVARRKRVVVAATDGRHATVAVLEERPCLARCLAFQQAACRQTEDWSRHFRLVASIQSSRLTPTPTRHLLPCHTFHGPTCQCKWSGF